MNYYINVLKKYAVFNGRASRKEFWMFFLFNLIFSVVAGILDGVIRITPLYVSSNGTVYGFIKTLYTLGVFIPTIAVVVRRLHDTNHSGWWILSFLTPALLLIPFTIIHVSSSTLKILLMVITAIFFLITLIYLYFLTKDSISGSNEYGPNPKEIPSAC